MLFVLLRVFGTVAFSHLLRFSQVRTRSPMQAAAINYLVAALGSALWTAAAGFRWHIPTLALGIVAGVTYVSSLLLVFPAMRRSGVSVTGAVLPGWFRRSRSRRRTPSASGMNGPWGWRWEW